MAGINNSQLTTTPANGLLFIVTHKSHEQQFSYIYRFIVRIAIFLSLSVLVCILEIFAVLLLC